MTDAGSYTGTDWWHLDPEEKGRYAFGTPVAGPTRTVSSSGEIVYARKYQRANITLTCPAPSPDDETEAVEEGVHADKKSKCKSSWTCEWC